MDKILIAASTHWDREWYRTFQEFQIRLCGLMNRLITLLEQDEEFLCYTFDGQSAVLEDYLEIYPENRGRIEKLAAEGRLVFGPLYNLSLIHIWGRKDHDACQLNKLPAVIPDGRNEPGLRRRIPGIYI